MCTIPSSGLLGYLRTPPPHIKQVIIPTIPRMLKGGQHTKNHGFIESPLVMNDISNVLGKRGLPFAEGAEHKAQRESLLLAYSYVHVQGLVPGLWSEGVEMIEKVVKVGCASRNSPSCREEEEEGVVVEVEWRLSATPDIIGFSSFSFELRTPECASTVEAIPKKSLAPS